MAFIKYREVTKHFKFNQVVEIEKLPKYVTDYISSDEVILAAYKTRKDYGVFTSRNIILFDNSTYFGIQKDTLSISYRAFQTLTISYMANVVKFNVFLNSGYPLKLQFSNVSAKEKTRIRRLFFCIKRSMNHLELRDTDIESLSSEAINHLNY